MIYNDGLRYTVAVNHTASDSTAPTLSTIRAMKITSTGGAVVYTLNGTDVTDYFTQGVIYPIGGNVSLIKATGTVGTTSATFVLYG